jgi:acyl-CoA thioesterase
MASPTSAAAMSRDPAPATPTPQEVCAHMFAADRASQGLGMRIVAVGAGSARLEMAIRDDMLNGHDICHGGFITTLADSAFAFACNSRNEATVASGLIVDFLAPVKRGDVLTADAVEVARTGRTGVYDIVVTNRDGVQVALVRGRSTRLGDRTVLPVAPIGEKR